MNKAEFLWALENGLSGLSKDELNERISFYSEIIDDKVEDGLSEEEAVSELGEIGDIIKQTVSDIPLSRLVKEKVRTKRTLRAWEIVLIILGFPLWFPLLVAAAAVVISVYISIWAIIISLWAVVFSLFICFHGGVAAAVLFAAKGNAVIALAALSSGLICAGLGIFLLLGCLKISRLAVTLTKKAAYKLKAALVGEGQKQ